MDLDARLQLNTRVLQRIDPCALHILASASFVVYYTYENEWTKTSVEGPLFLYQRSEAPYYGLQILNRNDPEPFYVGITPSDDVEISEAFLIYRAHQPDDGNAGDHTIYGFWIFEPSQLEQLAKTITSLQEAPYPPPAPTSLRADHAPTSISMDALFGQPEAPTFTEQERTGASILNALFREASDKNQDTAPEPEVPEPASQIQSTPIDLDTLFGTASVQESSDPMAMEPVDELRAPKSPPTSIGDTLPASQVVAGLEGHLSRADFVQKLIVQLCTDQAYVEKLYAEYQRGHR